MSGMSQGTLSTQLQNMGLYGDEPSAIEAWAEAFTKYFEDAVATVVTPPMAIPVVVSQLRAGGGPKAQMKAGMTGLSVAGAASIAAGVSAFWAKLATTQAVYFVGSLTLAPPAGLSGLAAALLATFAANIAAKADKPTAMGAIATTIHGCNLGSVITFPGSPNPYTGTVL
jgi:hypothetical protein